MASQGPITNTSVLASNLATVGSYDWTLADPNPAVDQSFGSTPGDQLPDAEYSVKLLVGGSVVGTDQATGFSFGPGNNPVTYGGPSSTFGASPTAAQVNASGFGIALAVRETFSGTISHYIAVPFPGFTIPAGATIDGIKFDISWGFDAGNNIVNLGSTTQSCTVYYTVAPPSNSIAPAITGTVQVGQVLTCSDGTWTGSPTSHSKQWKRADDSGFATNVTNVGTDSSTFTTTASELGKYIRCTDTATNAGGSTAANSNVVGPVLPPVPVNSVAPAVTPSPASVGQACSCTTGTWSNSPTSYAYQWKLDGSNVGTNSSSYTPVAAGTLTCTVTPSNAGGAGTPAVSNSVTVVAGGNRFAHLTLMGST